MVMVGTRSEIIKFSSIIRELKKNKNFDLKILHTGQTDTGDLMKRLDLPEPDFQLGKSFRRTWAKKGKIMSSLWALRWLVRVFFRIMKIFLRESPDAVFYQGNCMTVPIAAFAARASSKNIILIHRESGIRTHSYFEPFLGDLSEKIGDDFGNILFAPSKTAENNLRKEHVSGKIYNAGDPHVEIVNYVLRKSKKISRIKEKYILVNILHYENVTDRRRMENLVDILIKSPFHVVFPISVSAKGRLELFGLFNKLKKYSHIAVTDPLNYVEFLNLLKNSEAVLTDSGGVQQESFILKIPCIFLGKINVWKEFEDIGIVKATAFDVSKTLHILDGIKNKDDFYKKAKSMSYPLGAGQSTERIVKILEKNLLD